MRSATIRILIVEDELAVRQFFLRALSRLCPDLELISAEHGRVAQDYLRTTQIDLILSDQRMPVMNGLELLHSVRAESDLPFIFISADHSIEEAVLAAGATAFLAKPVALNALRAAVRNALRSRLTCTYCHDFRPDPPVGPPKDNSEHRPQIGA